MCFVHNYGEFQFTQSIFEQFGLLNRIHGVSIVQFNLPNWAAKQFTSSDRISIYLIEQENISSGRISIYPNWAAEFQFTQGNQDIVIH